MINEQKIERLQENLQRLFFEKKGGQK